MPTNLAQLAVLSPELILIVAAVAIFLMGTWIQSRLAAVGVALVGIALAALLWSQQVPASWNQAGGMVREQSWVLDHLSFDFRGVSLILVTLLAFFSMQSRQTHVLPEILGNVLILMTGLMLVCGATDLIVLFVGLEMISIPTYVLLFLGGSHRAAGEATAKYFYLSILSSAILLYGFATLYGLAGDTQLGAIQASMREASSGPFQSLIPLAILMILSGLCFKITAAPFHFYAPDVYQATSSMNAAILSVIPKIAGVVAMVRILIVAFPHESATAWQVVVVLSLVTMTIANVTALWQTNFRRLMAYSSIAHAGYLLIGLSAALATSSSTSWGPSAVAAMLFYLLTYAAGTIGAFACVAFLSDDDTSFSNLEEFAGLGHHHPVIAGLLAICMFSLSGIPPLAGFFGKFALFRAAMTAALPADGGQNAWFLVLGIVGVMNAAIAAAYYLRVIAAMYFDRATAPQEARLANVSGNHGAGLTGLVSALLVVALGVFSGRFLSHQQQAAQSLWPTTVSQPNSVATPRVEISATIAQTPVK